MRYKVDLDVITLEEAVNLMESVPRLTVFYTYGIGKPIHLLNRDSLATSIKNKAIYLTPAGFVEVK